MFWKTAGAIRTAGYDSIFSLTQDAAGTQNPVPLLTREGGPGSRGTRHLRLLIPKGITGISEKDRSTLQAWIELVDWTRLGVLPKSQVPRKLKLNMDPMSQMHQWLTKKELQHGIKDHETAQLFVDNRIELKRLADAIRNQDPNAESRVELMNGGEVLGTALIAWLSLAVGRWCRTHKVLPLQRQCVCLLLQYLLQSRNVRAGLCSQCVSSVFLM